MRHPKGCLIFYGMDTGLERPLRKHAGGMFLGRGRVPFSSGASRQGCERRKVIRWCSCGTRKGSGSFAAAKTVRWHVFSPWESPAPQGASRCGLAPVRVSHFLWNGYGTRRERPARRAGKKVSSGHFFSSGESPLFFGRIPSGVWTKKSHSLVQLWGSKGR